MDFICCRNWMLHSSFWITKVLSTSMGHSFGGWVAELMALVSNSSMNRLATMGLIGIPCLPHPMHLFIMLTLEGEKCFKAELQDYSNVLY